jgi:hypothetical protein
VKWRQKTAVHEQFYVARGSHILPSTAAAAVQGDSRVIAAWLMSVTRRRQSTSFDRDKAIKYVKSNGNSYGWMRNDDLRQPETLFELDKMHPYYAITVNNRRPKFRLIIKILTLKFILFGPNFQLSAIKQRNLDSVFPHREGSLTNIQIFQAVKASARVFEEHIYTAKNIYTPLQLLAILDTRVGVIEELLYRFLTASYHSRGMFVFGLRRWSFYRLRAVNVQLFASRPEFNHRLKKMQSFNVKLRISRVVCVHCSVTAVDVPRDEKQVEHISIRRLTVSSSIREKKSERKCHLVAVERLWRKKAVKNLGRAFFIDQHSLLTQLTGNDGSRIIDLWFQQQARNTCNKQRDLVRTGKCIISLVSMAYAKTYGVASDTAHAEKPWLSTSNVSLQLTYWRRETMQWRAEIGRLRQLYNNIQNDIPEFVIVIMILTVWQAFIDVRCVWSRAVKPFMTLAPTVWSRSFV